MKILISAYACESGRGGEGEIGWRMVHELAALHDVWVITRANLETIHEARFARDGRPDRLNFIYFDLPWIFRFYKRGRRFFLLYYYFWQIGSGLLARRLVAEKHFDLVHHLTGGMDWMPAGLALAQVPLVWGPVGSEDTHPVILRRLPAGSRIKDRLRLLVRGAMRRLDPLVRLSGYRAASVLSHTPDTMPRHLSPKLRPFSQTGIEPEPAIARPKDDLARKGPLKIVFAGELKDWKGALLALQAALNFFGRAPEATMTIVGDGPLREPMQRLIDGHPQGHRVTMAGRLPMEQLVAQLRQGDVFLYPSFHHGLATVVLQAMLTGLPVVCLDGDATGRTVGQRAGITVALSDDRNPVAGLADALEKLSRDEPLRMTLAGEAQRIAREEHSYAAMAAAIDRVYREIRETGS